MEQLFDRASGAVAELSAALDKYQAAQETIATLSAYYGSDEWKQDFADYEAGKLKNIDIVPFSANRTGKVYVNMKKDNFVLEAGDKIMLWNSLAAIKPMCEDLEIK